jgi:hypothetical protein
MAGASVSNQVVSLIRERLHFNHWISLMAVMLYLERGKILQLIAGE